MLLSFKVFENFVETISKPQTIIGLVLVIVSFVLMLLTKKLVDKIKPEATEEEKMTYMIIFKVVAAVIAIAGLLIAVLI